MLAKREASRSGILQRASVAPAGLEIAFKVEPGRSTTTIGTRSAIKRQCRHRWNWRRLSAPMIQTKSTPGARRLSQRSKARADLRLDVGDHDVRPDVEPTRGLDAGVERRQARQRLQGIAGCHQPPDAVEREPAQRKPGDERMPLVRRVERAAKEADAHSGHEWRQARNGRHHAACAASSSAWRSAVSPSTISSRPSPSMIRSSE
jgi:hypothetical protein